MGEWIIGIILGDYIGTTIGIHSPIPSQAPGSLGGSLHEKGSGPGSFKGDPDFEVAAIMRTIEHVSRQRIHMAAFEKAGARGRSGLI